MKQEDKAKAYDKVRKKIAIRFGSNIANEFFAEFEESKDEEIRKALLEMVHDTTGDELWVDYNVHKEEALTWLENQGQVKESTISQHEIETCKENNNSLTSEDEKIRKEIINYFQCQSEEEPTRKEIHDKWIAWLENIPYTIDHEKREGFHLGYKACLEKQNEQKSTDSYCQENCKGFQETGKCFADGMCNAKREAEQKPEENKGNIGGISPNWSEGDDMILSFIVNNLKFIRDTLSRDAKYVVDVGSFEGQIEWLQSLQGRVQPQPKQEWSEEDEQHVDSLLKRLDALCRNKFERTRFAISEDRDWLKSLKERIGGKI